VAYNLILWFSQVALCVEPFTIKSYNIVKQTLTNVDDYLLELQVNRPVVAVHMFILLEVPPGTTVLDGCPEVLANKESTHERARRLLCALHAWTICISTYREQSI